MALESTFGVRLRGERLRRGVALEDIARATNVPVALWEALEDDVLHGWPSGVLARAWVGDYARLVGLDAKATIDEFCRRFPHGDRRRSSILNGLAEAVGGQPTVWTDASPREERRAPLRQLRHTRAAFRRAQIVRTMIDVAGAIALGAVLSLVTSLTPPIAIITAGIVYFAFSTGARVPLSTRLKRWLDQVFHSNRHVRPADESKSVR